jgi:hypothetical protein
VESSNDHGDVYSFPTDFCKVLDYLRECWSLRKDWGSMQLFKTQSSDVTLYSVHNVKHVYTRYLHCIRDAIYQ